LSWRLGGRVCASAREFDPCGEVTLPALDRGHASVEGANARDALETADLDTSANALEIVRAHRVEIAVVGGMAVPAELEGVTWISREEGSATRAAVETARWQIGLRVARARVAVVGGGKARSGKRPSIAAISRFALGLELEAGTLVVLDLPRWRVTRTIAAVTADDVPLTPPAANFLTLLRETLSTEPNALEDGADRTRRRRPRRAASARSR
jgi:hypothetical protein